MPLLLWFNSHSSGEVAHCPQVLSSTWLDLSERVAIPREGGVNDIATSEDILGEIILYKTLRENIFVYFKMSALYI